MPRSWDPSDGLPHARGPEGDRPALNDPRGSPSGVNRRGTDRPTGSPRGALHLTAVDRQRVDHQDVDGDDDDAPEGVGLDEEEIRDRAEPGEQDGDGPGGQVA